MKAGSSSPGLPFGSTGSLSESVWRRPTLWRHRHGDSALLSPGSHLSVRNRDRIVEKGISGLFQPSPHSVTLLGCLGCIWLGGVLSVYYSRSMSKPSVFSLHSCSFYCTYPGRTPDGIIIYWSLPRLEVLSLRGLFVVFLFIFCFVLLSWSDLRCHHVYTRGTASAFP